MSGQAIDLVLRVERGVLGAALRDETTRRVVLGTLSPEDYAEPAHGAAHAALVRLSSAGEWVDWENVLRVGETRLLGRLVPADLLHAGRGRTVAQVQSWCWSLREAAAGRRLRRELEAAGADSERPGATPASYLEASAKALAAAQHRCARRAGASAADVAMDIWRRLEAPVAASVPTGLSRLDVVLGGMRAGRLYVVAGRAAMGKTAFAGTLTRAACEWDASRRVLFFSLEMQREELGTRWLAGLAGLDSRRIERRTLDDDATTRLTHASERFARWPLVIEDDGALTIADLCARAAVAHAVQPLSLVVVDYLQLIKGSDTRRYESREREVAEISRSLKQLSKDLSVPVVALAQLNRDVEKRAEKRPGAADLRESGAIEQDADAVMLLYRPGVYDPSVDKGVAEVIVAKNRGGETDTVQCRYVPHETRFMDCEHDAPPVAEYEPEPHESEVSW